MPRGLSEIFMSDLITGLLRPILERVQKDKSLCLEIREDYINIYYRGGNLLKISKESVGYTLSFDKNYLENPDMLILPSPKIAEISELANWLQTLPNLKQAIDLYAKNTSEREFQQLVVRDNNFGSIARSTDYYICDIEYQNETGRFDLIAVRWPSTGSTRKKQDSHRLILGEVKYGDNALDGVSGLHAHIQGINKFLSNPGNLSSLKNEMVKIFQQKKALGLLDVAKDLTGFGDELPMILLLLVNHDPEKSRLKEILQSLPDSPHAEVRIATSSFLGYGLFDPAIIDVKSGISRL
ncbi:MAG: hypothetical protein OEW39_04940 [Deltaproteobacteria bacterium]|nr:hypothetical protein [Deltaproteobacteria bacterium]